MKKALLGFTPFILALALAGAAVAAEVAPAVPETQACRQTAAPLPLAGAAEAPAALELFTPEPLLAGPCPRIGCGGSTMCKQDQDCTAFPGGVCNKFCPSMGCCGYPAL